MPRLFPFAHPRHRQHQAIFPPPRRPHLMEIGAGHSRSSKPFPTAGKQKGLGLGAWETNRNRFPKSPKPNPLAFAITHSTLFVDALRLNVNVVRQFLKEISMQDARDVRNDLRVQTVVRNTIGIPPTGFVPTAWPTSPPTVLVGRALL